MAYVDPNSRAGADPAPSLTSLEERKKLSEQHAQDLIDTKKGEDLSLYQRMNLGLISPEERNALTPTKLAPGAKTRAQILAERGQLGTVAPVTSSTASNAGTTSSITSATGTPEGSTSFSTRLRTALQDALDKSGGSKLLDERAKLRAQLFGFGEELYNQYDGLTGLTPDQQRDIQTIRDRGLRSQLQNLDIALQQRGVTLDNLVSAGVGIYGDDQALAEQRQAEIDAYYAAFGYIRNPLTGLYSLLPGNEDTLGLASQGLLEASPGSAGGGSSSTFFDTVDALDSLSEEERAEVLGELGLGATGEPGAQPSAYDRAKDLAYITRRYMALHPGDIEGLKIYLTNNGFNDKEVRVASGEYIPTQGPDYLTYRDTIFSSADGPVDKFLDAVVSLYIAGNDTLRKILSPYTSYQALISPQPKTHISRLTPEEALALAQERPGERSAALEDAIIRAQEIMGINPSTTQEVRVPRVQSIDPNEIILDVLNNPDQYINSI